MILEDCQNHIKSAEGLFIPELDSVSLKNYAEINLKQRTYSTDSIPLDLSFYT